MKKKSKNYLLIGTISIILGIIISVQFRVVQNDYFEGSNPFARSQELNSAYKVAIDERNFLSKRVEELEAELLEIQSSASSDNVLVKNLSQELERYKLLGGFLDVQGEGIQIILDNPVNAIGTSDINIIYEYDLLNVLVNEMNAAGAEAISINDERIISITEIRTAGNSITINSVPKFPPFIIKAIGSKETLDGAVSQIFGIVATLRNKGYFVEVKKSDQIEIMKYNGFIEFDFANIIRN